MKIIPRFDYELTPKGRTQKVVFHLTIEAPPADGPAIERSPINLGLVLDRSGSMSGDKIAHTIKAASLVVDNLTERDRLGVVIYDDVVDTLVEPRAVTNKDAIKKRIGTVTARGCTNLSGGYLRGEELVRSQYDASRINRVILMTDGLANAGVTDAKSLAAMAAEFKGRGVATTTIGFGDDFDEDLLKAMADAGGGNFFYIENPDQAPAIFREELGELLAILAQDLVLTIAFKPGVQMGTLLNDYPHEFTVKPDADNGGGTVQMRLGDAFAGEEKIIVCELDLPAIHDDGPLAIADITLSYTAMRPSIESRTDRLAVTKPLADPAVCEKQERSAKVLEDAALLQIARSQRIAREQAAAGEIHAASATLQGTMAMLKESEALAEKYADEMAELNAQTAQLDSGGYDQKMAKQLSAGSYARARKKGKYKS